MSTINERIAKLQPFVLSIRFNQGLTVIDTAFTEGWTVPKPNTVGYEQTPDKPNYYMLYGLVDSVGIDEILDYVDKVIEMNVERENKFKLLKVKKKELENIFRNSTLQKCQSLKFSFSNQIIDGDDMSMADLPLNINESASIYETGKMDIPDKVTPQVTPYQPEPQVPQMDARDLYLREQEELLGGQPQLDDRDRYLQSQEELLGGIQEGEPPLVQTVEREMDSEIEAWNRSQTNSGPTTAKVGGETFDLPPKNKNSVVLEEFNIPTVICKCDPNDPNAVCPECMSYKM